MNKKTEKALRGSIKKWQGVVDGTKGDLGVDNCPLCTLFFNQGCIRCPVMDRTGYSYCKKTPYDAWDLYQYKEYCSGRYVSPYEGYAATPKAKKLAKAELKFLESLLPENNKEVKHDRETNSKRVTNLQRGSRQKRLG